MENKIITKPHLLIYRGLDKQEYTVDFVEKGKFLLRPIEYYRNIEDHNRKDKDEGVGKLRLRTPRMIYDPNTGIRTNTKDYIDVNFGLCSTNPTYILCFSGPQVDIQYLREKHGPYLVRINNPERLLADISYYLKQRRIVPNEHWVKLVKVRYDKDQVTRIEPARGSEARANLPFSQKSPVFSWECEYRIVVELDLLGTGKLPPEVIHINLAKKLGYAEILE